MSSEPSSGRGLVDRRWFGTTSAPLAGDQQRCDDQTARSARAVRAIAEDLLVAITEERWQAASPIDLRLEQLATGEAGMAVFFSEAFAYFRDERYADAACRVLDLASSTLTNGPRTLGLFAGATGVGWAINQAARLGVYGDAADDVDVLDDFDEVVLDCVVTGGVLESDLMMGAAGVGTYALVRPARGVPLRIVEAVCSQLRDSAEPVMDGRAWPSLRGDYFTPEGPPEGADGMFAIGAAHGVSGIIGFLARVIAAGHDFGAGELLEAAMRVLVDAIDPAKSDFKAPRMTDRRGRTWGAPSFTWCWGDLGVASAAICAGVVASNREWITLGRCLAAGVGQAIDSSLYAETPVGPSDSSLCHGLAGPAHALHSLARMTEDAALARLASRWLDGLLRASEASGYGGYRFHQMDASGARVLASAAGLLMGSAGVGLTLLRTCNPSPHWDGVMHMEILKPQ